MTNKEKLKKIIEQDINPESYYKKIINKIEKEEKMNKINKTWKYALVPLSLIVIICGSLFLNFKTNNNIIFKNNPDINEVNKVTLNINEINSQDFEILKLDADIKTVSNDDINFLLPYNNELVNIPKDLDKTNTYIFYTKENRESKDYNILYNYEIIYSNDNNKSISVQYSKNHKPLRDYYFDEEGSKTTTINDIKLKIYKFNNTYFTEFNYNDYNFDIETSKITEQELKDFLVSILK